MKKTPNFENLVFPATVKEVAKFLRTGIPKVSTWCSTGELEAVDIAARTGGKNGRWRITRDALEAFLAARMKRARPQPVTRPRRKPEKAGEYC